MAATTRQVETGLTPPTSLAPRASRAPLRHCGMNRHESFRLASQKTIVLGCCGQFSIEADDAVYLAAVDDGLYVSISLTQGLF
jgi:hypothetical protein